MPKPVIKIDQVSKKFIINHESKERYTALRDVIINKAKSLASFNKKGSSKEREEFYALQDVSFEVNEGDRIGIIGRNGAGKSTLLKILSRITEPSSGRITVRGRIASLLEVGTGFHPELTGRENIFLNGAILGMSRAEIRAKFDEIVAFAEIEKFLDTPVKRYSSGMYVRLAFAVAAHLEPEILIVDEVLAVGDSQFQKKCLGKMEDVSKNQGRTVLFVSHNMGVISQLCERAVLLKGGKLIQVGKARKVIDDYILNSGGNSNVYLASTTGNSKEIFISKVETLSTSGKNSEDFQFDESIILKVSLSVAEFVPGVKISVTLQNTNGEYLSTFVEDLRQFYNNEKDVTISFKFPSKIIAPNSYGFRVAIFVPNGNVFDLVELICPIKIFDSGTSMSLYEGINYGSFFLNYELLNKG
jgi:lipopolysaccharide transport system ATP-binding protein